MSLAIIFIIDLDLFLNDTLEERVALLETQVTVIQDDVTDLEVNLMELQGDVNFLFDEQVIQDERLLNLEKTSNGIIGELDLIGDELESKLIKTLWNTFFASERYFLGNLFSLQSDLKHTLCISFNISVMISLQTYRTQLWLWISE